MRLRIHDLSADPVTTYVIDDPADAHDETDRLAAELAAEHDDVITIGCVIAEPIFQASDRKGVD